MPFPSWDPKAAPAFDPSALIPPERSEAAHRVVHAPRRHRSLHPVPLDAQQPSRMARKRVLGRLRIEVPQAAGVVSRPSREHLSSRGERSAEDRGGVTCTAGSKVELASSGEDRTVNTAAAPSDLSNAENSFGLALDDEDVLRADEGGVLEEEVLVNGIVDGDTGSILGSYAISGLGGGGEVEVEGEGEGVVRLRPRKEMSAPPLVCLRFSRS